MLHKGEKYTQRKQTTTHLKFFEECPTARLHHRASTPWTYKRLHSSPSTQMNISLPIPSPPRSCKKNSFSTPKLINKEIQYPTTSSKQLEKPNTKTNKEALFSTSPPAREQAKLSATGHRNNKNKLRKVQEGQQKVGSTKRRG